MFSVRSKRKWTHFRNQLGINWFLRFLLQNFTTKGSLAMEKIAILKEISQRQRHPENKLQGNSCYLTQIETVSLTSWKCAHLEIPNQLVGQKI